MLHIPKKGPFSGLLLAGFRDLSLECSVYRNVFACLRPWAGLSHFEQLVYVSNLFMVNICFFSGGSTCLHDQSPKKTQIQKLWWAPWLATIHMCCHTSYWVNEGNPMWLHCEGHLKDSTWFPPEFFPQVSFPFVGFTFHLLAIISYTWKHKNFRTTVLETPNVTLRHILDKSAYSFSSKDMYKDIVYQH